MDNDNSIRTSDTGINTENALVNTKIGTLSWKARDSKRVKLDKCLQN